MRRRVRPKMKWKMRSTLPTIRRKMAVITTINLKSIKCIVEKGAKGAVLRVLEEKAKMLNRIVR